MHHDADEVADVGAAAGDVEAGDAQEAAAGSGEAREGAEERRLAGAVGAEKGEDASPAELEVEASNDGSSTKPLGQARGADGRVGGGHARLPSLELCEWTWAPEGDDAWSAWNGGFVIFSSRRPGVAFRFAHSIIGVRPSSQIRKEGR